MLDDDGDDEIEIDEEEVVNYVIKNAQKDGVGKFETGGNHFYSTRRT